MVTPQMVAGWSWTRLHHRAGHYALLLAAGAVLFLWNLGGASLWDMDEGKNATAALEMFEAHNWVVPTFNGELRADKPALLYWLQIATYYALGVSEQAARLPSALAALATLLAAYELARALFGKNTGLLAGLIAATSPMLCGAARFANPDALLNLASLLTLLIFWLGHRRLSTGWWFSLGAVTGLGMLAKGPVGLVLPALVGVLFMVWEGRARALLDRRAFLAVLSWCLVALPWYVWVTVDTKANFLRGFILRHNVERFLSPLESHAGSPLYYLGVLLVGTAPWSVFAGAVGWCALWSLRRREHAAQATDGVPPPMLRAWEAWAADRQPLGPEVSAPASAYRFLVAWIAVYLAFFTLAATKLPNYVLPAVVPCAILTARFLERWRSRQLVVPAWFLGLSLALMALVGVSIGTGIALASGIGELPLLRGRFIPGLAPWAWLGLVPVVGAAVCWRLGQQQRRTGLIACLTLSAVLLFAPLAAWGSVAFNHVKAPRSLAELTGAGDRARDLRIGAWRLEHLPSLNFYVQRDVLPLQSEADLRGLLRYPVPVYVFLPASAWEQCSPRCRRLGREIARHADFYRNAQVVVLTNQIGATPVTGNPNSLGGLSPAHRREPWPALAERRHPP
jgi:4-amino-4-deoxy-L-arabinose transferase-like glycosyltransferase